MDLDLTEETIVNMVMDYLEEDIYNYAIMIDGDWGSGKTYFVKNSLIHKIKDKYKDKIVIYVSLYGINTLTELDKQIYMSKYINGDEKTFNVASSAMSLGFDYLRAKGIKLNEKNIRKMLGSLLSIEPNSILIFDDLERCKIPINDLLGYINQFVEHQNLKIIIVANEKEINKSIDKNLELKYLVASLNHIDILEDFELFEDSWKKSKPDDFMNIESLKDRVNKIFSNKDQYNSIKEKLIGFTISYRPNIKQCLITIINKKSEGKLRDILKSHVGDFYDMMIQMEHVNFRTFQFYLVKIISIYKKVMNLDLKQEHLMIRDKFIDILILNVFEQCIFLKKDGFLHYGKNTETFVPKNGDNVYHIYTSFEIDFVKIYVQFSLFDEDLIKNSIDLYYIKYSSYANKKYQILQSAEFWFTRTEKEVIKIISELKAYLSDDEYCLEDYERIIAVVIKLKYLVDLDYFDEFVNIMKSNIANRKEYLDDIKLESNLFEQEEEKEQKEEFVNIIKKLNKCIKVRNEQLDYIRISTLFEKELWCSNLLEEKTILIDRMYKKAPIDIFADINISELMTHLYKQTKLEIIKFRTYINLWQRTYHKRIPQYTAKIIMCIQYISENQHDDRIKYVHLKALKHDFEKILASISQKEDNKEYFFIKN